MEELKNFLEINKLSYRKFCEKSGVSLTALQYILSGKRLPSLTAAFRIQEATLGVVNINLWKSHCENKKDSKKPKAKRKKN